jgi:hypothetical protein
LSRSRSLRLDRLIYLLSNVVALDYYQDILKTRYGFQFARLTIEEESRRKTASCINYTAGKNIRHRRFKFTLAKCGLLIGAVGAHIRNLLSLHAYHFKTMKFSAGNESSENTHLDIVSWNQKKEKNGIESGWMDVFEKWGWWMDGNIIYTHRDTHTRPFSFSIPCYFF